MPCIQAAREEGSSCTIICAACQSPSARSSAARRRASAELIEEAYDNSAVRCARGACLMSSAISVARPPSAPSSASLSRASPRRDRIARAGGAGGLSRWGTRSRSILGPGSLTRFYLRATKMAHWRDSSSPAEPANRAALVDHPAASRCALPPCLQLRSMHVVAAAGRPASRARKRVPPPEAGPAPEDSGNPGIPTGCVRDAGETHCAGPYCSTIACGVAPDGSAPSTGCPQSMCDVSCAQACGLDCYQAECYLSVGAGSTVNCTLGATCQGDAGAQAQVSAHTGVDS
jgi:hypothetical protein